jgi:glycosyltransferase involved in cell wall biosynthesis
MKISVVIPAYNAASTIGATVESVLAQTITPDEIMVLDDGSTDDTFSCLQAYQSRITIIRQSNGGVAHARNCLCKRAGGEIIAFLDADDIWHPKYLEIQHAALGKNPEAVASFVGHVSFRGNGGYAWAEQNPGNLPDFEVIEPLNFLERYNHCPGPFGSPSFCCIRKWVLTQMGREPFSVKVTGADDFYLMNILPLYGPVLYTEEPLAAYRVTPGSISSNRLKSVELAVSSFEILVASYGSHPEPEFVKVFNRAFASKRRQYAKFLMGAGRSAEARRQLRYSLMNASGPLSMAKSLGVLFSTYMPGPLGPRWPAAQRDMKLAQNGL